LAVSRVGKIVWAAVTSLFLAASPRIASAGVVETVRDDLRPISGVVVMQQDGDYPGNPGSVPANKECPPPRCSSYDRKNVHSLP